MKEIFANGRFNLLKKFVFFKQELVLMMCDEIIIIIIMYFIRFSVFKKTLRCDIKRRKIWWLVLDGWPLPEIISGVEYEVN